MNKKVMTTEKKTFEYIKAFHINPKNLYKVYRVKQSFLPNHLHLILN